MTKIKDIPKIDRPREKLKTKGPEALSNSDLLAILLGNGIKGKNVQKLAQQIIRKFGASFLNVTVEDLKGISGIGETKALQVVSAISLVNRYYSDRYKNEIIINTPKEALLNICGLEQKKKEYLVCLYLNARNRLIKKEIVTVGLLDKTLLHPREIFQPAVELNAASIILVHNHPSGDSSPSEEDSRIVNKITQAGEIMGINVIDFIIVSEDSSYSFYSRFKGQNDNVDYVADGLQGTLFDVLQTTRQSYDIDAQKIQETYFYVPQSKINHFQLQNRRYIGGKYKLIEWIFSIINNECEGSVFTDIFAGTGIVSAVASRHFKKIIINDFLHSNYAVYRAFFGKGSWDTEKIYNIIRDYNNINGADLADNFFSINFGGKYFSKNSAKVIGFIRENIEQNRVNLSDKEYYMLIASLLYSIDKIANTVGHYDAYFKKDFIEDRFFMRPIDPVDMSDVLIFQEDANLLVKKIKTDIMYIDPPYNSRQYSRFYHVLETLVKWDSPNLYGVALKPEPENMSDYCRANAREKFSMLVNDADANYLVVSYNNTYDSKSSSSQNKITLKEIKNILNKKGTTKVFEKEYRHFNTGNTNFNNHKEYLFVTKVNHV